MFLFIAFMVVFIVEAPAEAAKVVKETGESAGEWFATASQAFARFLSSLI